MERVTRRTHDSPRVGSGCAPMCPLDLCEECRVSFDPLARCKNVCARAQFTLASARESTYLIKASFSGWKNVRLVYRRRLHRLDGALDCCNVSIVSMPRQSSPILVVNNHSFDRRRGETRIDNENVAVCFSSLKRGDAQRDGLCNAFCLQHS
eukprot:3523083-Alexandrium_andersonii.AAC.1